jgi:hypothetical protein
MDKIGLLIIIALVALCVVCYWSETPKHRQPVVSEETEGMAPLNTGTYDQGVKYGECNKGSFEPTDCSVGNCPMGTTVTDDRYCGIQCAQEVTEEDRRKCQAKCMELMRGGCH